MTSPTEPSPRAPIYLPAPVGEQPLRQGEIIDGLARVLVAAGSEDATPEYESVSRPSASIVISQDCDLEQDLRSVTSGKVTQEERPFPDTLLVETMPVGSTKTQIGEVLTNQTNRWECLEAIPRDIDATGKGVASMGVDFKRFFTISTTELYRQIRVGRAVRRARLAPPYAQHLATRFYNYQSRVALPRRHEVR